MIDRTLSSPEPLKYLAVTKKDAENIMDTFKVSHPQSRALMLRVSSIVLEFADEGDVQTAEKILLTKGASPVHKDTEEGSFPD